MGAWRYWWREIRWAWRCFRRYDREVYRTISPHPAPPSTVERLRLRVLSGDWSSPDERGWNRTYDEAMQWRDWQTCDALLEERERADWYKPEAVDGTE